MALKRLRISANHARHGNPRRFLPKNGVALHNFIRHKTLRLFAVLSIPALTLLAASG
jgi:hypothetical protein